MRANILQQSGVCSSSNSFAGSGARGAPRLIEAPGHMFSDTRHKVISIIGLSSIQDLERVARQSVDPRRFRANLYFQGECPWEEFSWSGREISVGSARLRVRNRIDRCAATDVNPDTAECDMNIPLTLQHGFGHIDFGVYAEVLEAGSIGVGDALIAA